MIESWESFCVGFFVTSLILASLLLVSTYPNVAKNNAEFFCDSRDMIVVDFKQDYGDLVFVNCTPIPINPEFGFYWERDSK